MACPNPGTEQCVAYTLKEIVGSDAVSYMSGGISGMFYGVMMLMVIWVALQMLVTLATGGKVALYWIVIALRAITLLTLVGFMVS